MQPIYSPIDLYDILLEQIRLYNEPQVLDLRSVLDRCQIRLNGRVKEINEAKPKERQKPGPKPGSRAKARSNKPIPEASYIPVNGTDDTDRMEP